jgi:hypothetical protein
MKKEFYVLPCGQEVTLFRTHFFGRTFQGVGLFSKLTTKPTENQRIFDS